MRLLCRSRALPEPGDQLIALALAQRRDRGRQVPLRAQDYRGARNPWEGQALGVRRSFFTVVRLVSDEAFGHQEPVGRDTIAPAL